MMLILWLSGCTSTQTTNEPAIQYTPPDPYTEDGVLVWQYIGEGEELNTETDGVFIPYWWFEKLYDYIVDVQAAQEIRGNGKAGSK